MEKQKKTASLLLALALPLAVGALSGLLTRGAMADYGSMAQPPLSPPGWVFPLVWTALYLLMGWASWRIWQGDCPNRTPALRLYGWQLAVNFLWPLVFFGGQRYGLALVVLLLLLVLVLLLYRLVRPCDKLAARLLLPYLLWLCFAAYLNLGVLLLN